MNRKKLHKARPKRMFTRLVSAALLPIFLVAHFAVAGDCQSQPAGQDRAIKLPNGLRVIVVEEPAFPIVSSQLWLHVGSFNDPPGASGTCHVVEHLLAETMRANGAALARQLVGSGGRYDAFTSDDFTVFLENLPSNQLELALALQAERLKDKTFTKQQLDDATKQVDHEIDSAHTTPERTLMREVRALRFTRHPYKNLPAGIDDEIKSITPQIANDFFKQHFVPSNATLVLAGDIKQAQALKLVEKYFGAIAARKPGTPQLIPQEPAQIGERRVYLKYGGKKNKLLVAFPAPAATESTAAAAAVLEALLGNSSGGLLKQFLIDTKVCDNASTAYELRKNPGMFSISCESPTTVNPGKMLSSVEELCDKLKDGGFEDSALTEAKKRAVFSTLKNKVGPYKCAFQLGFFASLNKLEQSDLWQRQLEAVSKQDVLRVAASYLVPAKRSVGFMLGQTSTPSSQKTAQAAGAGQPSNVFTRRVSRSDFGKLVIATYDPYLDGSKTDSTDEPQDETPEGSDAPSDSVPQKPIPSTPSKPISSPPSKPPGSSSPATASPPDKEEASHTEVRTPLSGLRSNLTEFIIPNGIRLIVFRAESSPVIRITGAVRAGHIYDPVNKPGVSDVTVALLNGSSAKISKENSAAMQAQNGLDRQDQIRFFEGREQISFHSNCLASDLATQLKLLSHHLTDPLIDDTTLSAARNTVAGTIKRRQNTTRDTANRLLLQNLLSDKSQFNPPSPHELLASVLKLNADDINQFRSGNIAPATTTIVLAGNIDPQQAQKLVTNAFSNWQGKAKTPSVSAHPNKRVVTKVHLPTDETAVEIALGRLLPTPISKPEYARLLLTDCALIKHPLYARLTNPKKVSDLDDSVNMQSILIPMAAQCAWILDLRMPENKIVSISNAIKNQMKELVTTGLSTSELAEMKRFIGGQVSVNRLNDVIHSADSIIDAVSTEREPDYWFNLPSAIDQTTLGDVNQFIKNEFQPDKACVVVAGSKQAIRLVPSFRRSKD